MLPELSVTVIVPVFDVAFTVITACVDLSDIASIIPEDPAATSVPPVIIHSDPKSIAVLPSFVGPDTYVSPPEMLIAPFESNPSPLEFTVSLPPDMLSTALLSEASGLLPVFESAVAALRASSEDTTLVVPPAILITCPSMPSTEFVILILPPTTLTVPSE